jgi:Fe-S-cluster containining protein
VGAWTQRKYCMETWFSDGLKFKCTGCGKCCTGSDGYVYLSKTDIDRFAEFFSISIEEFIQKHTRTVDGLIALLDTADHECEFLKEKRCTVYEARPTQCRTFPWWVQHLKTPRDWANAAHDCEGINHPEAKLISAETIQEQALSHLDNVIEQNFLAD